MTIKIDNIGTRDPTTLEKIKCVADFATDGCTMSPDLVFTECCYVHDINYAIGDISRQAADKKLKECISKNGYPRLCWVYWIGVRLYGWIPYYFSHCYQSRLEYKNNTNKT